MGSNPTAARRLAQTILVRVGVDAAFGERALNAALERTALTPRDRALTTELVYGTLRHQAALDVALTPFAPKLGHFPAPVLAALRLGAYQLLYTRVPQHSAVNESVALVQRYGRLRGVVNAVLRRLSNTPRPPAELPQDAESLATATSHPLWLVRALIAARGLADTQALLAANNATPPVVLRVNRCRTSRAALAERLRDAGVDVQELEDFADGLVVRRAGAIPALPGFEEGHFIVQDMAATLVGHLAAPKAGDFVLDACAAPGGKATHLAELMDDTGHVLAVERHPGKSLLITSNAARLGLSAVDVAVADASDVIALRALLAERGKDSVDVAVLDAPCAGMGTLRRNPELRQRGPEGMEALVALQARLLASVSACVRPGGTLVYAVCSLTEAEGPQQIAAFLEAHPHYRLEAPPPDLKKFTEGPYLRTWTHLHGTDCFFAARLVRHP